MKFCLAQLCTVLSKAKGSVVSWPNRSVGLPPCPAPPCPAGLPCAALNRPTRGMAGFFPDIPCMKNFTKTKKRWSIGQQPTTKSADKPLVNRSFRSSIGLQKISLVPAFEKTFKTGAYDALDGTRVGCYLAEPIRRRPVLPGPAPPRRPAVRRPNPKRPWYI